MKSTRPKLPQDLQSIVDRDAKIIVRKYKDVIYIRISELPLSDEIKQEFEQWMRGQTRPLIPGASDAVYAWDFDSWLLGKQGNPVPWD